MRPGVHPTLQLAYPPFGTGAHPPLWNPRQQSQKTCYRSGARDLQVPRVRPGASAPQRRRPTDVLSVVRKSRNSSGGLYRRRRRSAHDRRRANAIRFLMSTLLALISTAVDSCVPAKLSLDALGLCCCLRVVCEAWLRPSGVTCAPLLQRPYSARTFGTSPMLLLKAAATAIHSLSPSFAAVPSPSLTVLFPCVKQRRE